MDAQNDRPEYSREPTIDDLILLCRHLNEAGVKYVVIGGFAIILTGYLRTTGDIDLLVDSSPKNIERIKKALLYLPDQAVREIAPHEVAQYAVVRVADEVIVDLMKRACEVTYDKAEPYIQYQEAHGVRIPYPKPELLIQTKLSMRQKDVEDRLFLEKLINPQKEIDDRKHKDYLVGFRRLFQILRRLLFGDKK